MYFLTLADRQLLNQEYENADPSGDDFLLGCIEAAAATHGMDFNHASEAFDRAVAWSEYLNIDADKDAQAIGGEVLRLIRLAKSSL